MKDVELQRTHLEAYRLDLFWTTNWNLSK
jgi:hypothetical protein